MQSFIARQRGAENCLGAFALAGPAKARTTDLLRDSTIPRKNKSLRLFTWGLLVLFTAALLRADPAPTFSPGGGTYTSAQAVAISSVISGATIRYTTDGNVPSDTIGTIYTGPVTVSASEILQAYILVNGVSDSTVASAAYTINLPQVATPTLSPGSNNFYTSAPTVTISTTTSGAFIRYTTDNSTPTETNGTLYSGPVTVSNITLLALAYKSGSGLADSTVSGGFYVLQHAAPTYTPAAGTYASGQDVTITSVNSGDLILYTTDGSTPGDDGHGTVTGTYYSGPLLVNANTIIQAEVLGGNVEPSFVTTAVYTIDDPTPQVDAPSFSPAAGTYTSAQTVTITSATSGASIRYTLDGSMPTETNGTLYSGPLNLSSTATFNAIAYKSGFSDSNVSAAAYTINTPPPQVAAPSFNPAAGIYTSAQTVTITSATSGASIRYTLDGSPPTETNGTLYSGPINLSSTVTFMAIAYENGFADSNVTTAAYTINLPPQVVAPVFSPAAGTYAITQIVTITSATSGASFRYTLDGSTPTSTTGTIYSGPVDIISTVTLQAIAYKGGFTDSTVTFGLFAIGSPPPQVAAPLFSPAGGIYTSAQTVTITSTTSGASFRYTLDGSTPTETNGTLYSGPVNFNSTLTFMAIAYESGFVDSTVTTATYTINLPQQVVTPVFNSAAGTYAIAQIVTITSATSGASIRYTLDGSTPSETAGTLYSGPLSIGSTTTLTVIAYKAGFTDSPVTTGAYTISATTTPVSSPPPDSTSAPASGGGALDEWFLGALVALGLLRWWRTRR